MNEYVAGMGLVSILNRNENLVGAEIGVNTGVTSEYLLKNLSIETYYCIDPWVPYDGPSAGTTHNTEELADSHYNETLRRTEFAGDKVKILRMGSEDALKEVPDKSLDFVFIDGDHSYDAVIKDICGWWPKVKDGKIFAGHDYSHGDVNRALRQFFKDYFRTSVCPGPNDMWWAFKVN
ncbi:MAG: class I SAM-dependent methyltransferase [Ferruginibacter sp.]